MIVSIDFIFIVIINLALMALGPNIFYQCFRMAYIRVLCVSYTKVPISREGVESIEAHRFRSEVKLVSCF